MLIYAFLKAIINLKNFNIILHRYLINFKTITLTTNPVNCMDYVTGLGFFSFRGKIFCFIVMATPPTGPSPRLTNCCIGTFAKINCYF